MPAVATGPRQSKPRISDNARFQGILDRVKNDQLLIVARQRDGNTIFEPVGLTASETRLCRQASFQTRAASYFSRAERRQSFKVLIIKAQLELEGYQSVAEGTGGDVTPDLRNARLLFPQYLRHPELAEAIDTAIGWDKARGVVSAAAETVVPPIVADPNLIGVTPAPAIKPAETPSPSKTGLAVRPTINEMRPDAGIEFGTPTSASTRAAELNPVTTRVTVFPLPPHAAAEPAVTEAAPMWVTAPASDNTVAASSPPAIPVRTVAVTQPDVPGRGAPLPVGEGPAPTRSDPPAHDFLSSTSLKPGLRQIPAPSAGTVGRYR